MSKNLQNDEHVDNDPTDELPVLTDVIAAAEMFRQTQAEAEDGEDTGAYETMDAAPAGADERAAQVAKLEHALAARDARWRETAAELAGKDKELARLRSELAELENTAANQRDAVQQGLDELRARDRTIEALRQELDKEREQLSALEEDARTLERQVTALEAAQTAAQSSAEPTDRNHELHRLRDEVAALSQHIENRNDSWRDQAAALEHKATRIRELELELAQRVERQLAAEQHAEAESTRAREARKKLAEALDTLEHERERAARDAEKRASESRDAQPDAAAIERLVELETAIVNLERELEEVGGSAPEHAPPSAAPARLICLTGEQPGAYVLNKPAVTIGRGPKCEIQILTHYVSREHAQITTSSDGCVIEDLGSRNGVFVNSVRVERHVLETDDLVTVGDTQFRFQPGGQVPA